MTATNSKKVFIDGFQTYRIYRALRLHFGNTNYSVERYGTVMNRVSFEAYEKSFERYACDRLAKDLQTKDNITLALSAVLVRNPTIPLTDVDEFNYHTQLKRYRSSSAMILSDMDNMLNEEFFDDIKRDRFVQRVLGEVYSIELVCYLDRLVPFFKIVDETTKQTMLWNLVRQRLKKFEYFCILHTVAERDAIRGLILERFNRYAPEMTDLLETTYVTVRTEEEPSRSPRKAQG